jgi:hypothetical protein
MNHPAATEGVKLRSAIPSLPLEALLDHPQPLPSVLFSIPYSGWRLSCLTASTDRTTYLAFKEADLNHEHPALLLVGSNPARSDAVLSEGYWPFRPVFSPKHIVSGICLYTGSWGVRFAGADPGGASPRLLSLGLPGDLERMLRFIRKRRPILEFQIPTQPGLYHRRLIRWQKQILDRFPDVESVRYSLPIANYHGYIMHFEAALGLELPGLHAELDAYVETLKTYMTEVWGGHSDKVIYDIAGATDLKNLDASSRENDLQLYLQAAGLERVMGMEDLPEVALAHEVARRSGVLIPCAVAVTGLPDPYLERDDAWCACTAHSLERLGEKRL